jgi:AraC family transcriptional regulator
MTDMEFNDKRKKYLREEYVARINRVIDYIDKHIDEELRLEVLANVANFSRFHFHRIFGAMVGETLNQFIQRVRVERAAMQLVSFPKKSITDIAFDCGFSGSASFARAFRENFKMSPSQWRLEKSSRDSKICKINGKISQTAGKNRKDFDVSIKYNFNENQELIGKMTIPGGKFAVAHCEISVHEYQDSWNMEHGTWNR